MKKIFTHILACMAIALPLSAQDSKGNSTPEPIILKSLPLDNHPTTPIHRAPIRVEAEAWYEPTTETISIIYYGEAEGEANLYKDGLLIDNSSELNVTFPVSGSGFYTVEIITDNRTLTGSIEI